MRLFTIIASLILLHSTFSTRLYAQGIIPSASDSVKTYQLEELIVESDNAWIEGDKAVFLPTKRDKKLSNSVQTLLQRMHIPTLVITEGRITNIGGKDVTVFINGIRADEIDFSTFWPKQALRVEYMDHPSDPRFEGVECAVNFIVRTYETGGVAKINAFQQIRNKGQYSLSSKIEHGSMTYGIMLKGGYERDHFSSASGNDIYKELYYMDDFYGSIERSFSENSYLRSDNVDAAINARYNKGTTTITHTAALRWNNNPGSGESGNLVWNPALFPAGSSLTDTRSHALSPQLSGVYNIGLSRAWAFAGSWRYSNSHSNSSYQYRQEGTEDVENATVDNVNSAAASAAVSWRVAPEFSTWFQIMSSMDWFDTRYSGSANEVSRQHRGETVGNLNFWWRPSDKFVLQLRPGITVAYWKVGNEDISQVTPRGNVVANWSPSDKFFMNADLNYYRNNPTASASSDVTVRQTELLWSVGNPYLKGSDLWRVGMYINYMPLRWLRLANSLGWDRVTNSIITTYRPAPRDMGGLVRQDINGAPSDVFSWDLFISAYTFGNRLAISLQPTYRHYVEHGHFSQNSGWFRMRGSVNMDIGDFNIGVVYNGAEKFLRDCGTAGFKTSDEWAVTATYGTGDWYFDMRLEDIFHSRRKIDSWINNYNLISTRNTLSNGRCLRVSVSYTFGFGKKVNRNIEINGPAEIKSGSVKINTGTVE